MRELYTYHDGSQAWLEETELAEAKRQDAIIMIESLKVELAATDYKAIKYAEGIISAEDYVPIRDYRQGLRDRINELEEQLR